MAVIPTTARTDARSVPLPHAASSGSQRICIVGEGLTGATDEGLKKFAHAIASALVERHDVALLSTDGAAADLPAWGAVAPASRTFLSRHLYVALARRRPDLVIYAARPSTTFSTFVRARLLKAYCPGAIVAVLGLQARRHAPIPRAMIRYLAPDVIFVQAQSSKQYLERLGCRVELIPSGVDTARYRPVSAEQRVELRRQYGLATDRPVVLHAGHMQGGRGIRVLGNLAARRVCQVVLVTSSSTKRDDELAAELRQAGVSVITEFQPNVEQLYQLADCYVFPVESRVNAIEIPLSVLEAFACDLPVVTTPFGGLPRLFEQHACPGLVFVHSSGELLDETIRLCQTGVRGTRELAQPYAWEAIANQLLDVALARRQRPSAAEPMAAAHG